MAIEGDQGQWLQAKALQLKERALSTADRTRRKQFLLIATEYQKLAQQEDGGIALDVVERMVAPSPSTALPAGVVTRLRFAARPTPAVHQNTPERSLSRLLAAFRRPGIADLTIWALLAAISFTLLLAPGDQTGQGLKAVFDFLIE